MRRAILAAVLLLVGITCLKVHADDLLLLGVSNSKTASGINLVQHTANQTPGGVASANLTINGTTAGNFLIVGVWWCGIDCGEVAGNATLTVTSSNETCAAATSTWQNGNNASTQIWYCKNIAGGNDTITASFSGGGGNSAFPIISISEWSGVTTGTPDSGLGASGFLTSATSASCTISGSATQSGELIYSIIALSNSNTVTSPQTTINNLGNGPVDEYQKSVALTSYTNSTSFASANVSASCTAFKHP